jgi:GTP pyrophosphokinase
MIKKYAASRSNILMSFLKNRIRRKTKEIDLNKDEITLKYDMLVFGNDEEKLEYKLSPCCNPIQGDTVFGFLTINDGIKVHKINCPNSLSLQSNYAYRIINAKWIDSTEQNFTVKINISGIDTFGLANNITKVISDNMNVNMKKLNFETNSGVFSGSITMSVNSNNYAIKVMDKIKKLNGVEKVKRI